MSLSRNNHYIPQMYLSRWTDKGKICVYRLLVSHDSVQIWEPKFLEKTGSLSNLYINVLNDVEYDDLEHKFDTCFEAPAKEPFNKACNGDRLNSNDWSRIVDYTLAQYVRTPAFYLFVKEMGQQQIPGILDSIGQELAVMKELPKEKHIVTKETSILPVDVRFMDQKPDEEHTNAELSVVVGKEMWLFAMKHILGETSIIRKYFGELKWSIISAPEEDSWPTCDNPVVICDLYGKKIVRSNPGNGLGGNTKAILFPISPQKALLAMRTRKYPNRLKADNNLSTMIKTAIVNNALLYVYSNDRDKTIPVIRHRIVDEREFKRLANDFDSWFFNYKEIEGPLLRRN